MVNRKSQKETLSNAEGEAAGSGYFLWAERAKGDVRRDGTRTLWVLPEGTMQSLGTDLRGHEEADHSGVGVEGKSGREPAVTARVKNPRLLLGAASGRPLAPPVGGGSRVPADQAEIRVQIPSPGSRAEAQNHGFGGVGRYRCNNFHDANLRGEKKLTYSGMKAACLLSRAPASGLPITQRLGS